MYQNDYDYVIRFWKKGEPEFKDSMLTRYASIKSAMEGIDNHIDEEFD